MPSEKIVSPSSPASTKVTGLDATAPVSPDTVTTELSVAAKAVSDTRVTVMVLLAPATGLLWPMALVVKVCAPTTRILLANPSKIIDLPLLRKLIRFVKNERKLQLKNV